MKKLVVLFMAMLIATSAFAIVDPDDNMMGFYFDLEADTYCAEGIDPFQTTLMYLVVTNCTYDAIFGFEAGYEHTGGQHNILGTEYVAEGLNVGDDFNMIYGFAAPVPTAPVTLLATVSVFNMNTDPIFFDLHGSSPSSTGGVLPVIQFNATEVVEIGLSAADGLVAMINGCDVVATENVSFDGIKSLYR